MTFVSHWFKSRFEKEPSFEGLPDLAEDVNDNAYLAASVKAAEIDRQSGAYDEFLFSENHQTQMPYERAVDDHIELLTLRMRDRWRRVYLKREDGGIKAKARLSKTLTRKSRLEVDLNFLGSQIENEDQILGGEIPGQHGLFWPGARPIFVSYFSGLLRVALPALTFLLIGAVDVGIIYVSLDDIPGFTSTEAILFTLPALAVQLVFPHLIGKRINWDMHDHPKRLRNRFEMGLLLAVWAGFLLVMTQIRIEFIFTAAEDKGMRAEVERLFVELWGANLLMMIGLGSWILFDAARSNPHVHDLLRLLVRESRLRRRLQKLDAREKHQTEYLLGLAEASRHAEESFTEAVVATGHSLRLAAKSVYRRALVNGVGDAQFTSKYLEVNDEVGKGKFTK